MKYWIVIIAALFLASCKTKAGMVNTNTVTPYVVDENELTSKKVIENHYNNKRDFSTLYIRSSSYLLNTSFTSASIILPISASLRSASA